VGEFVIAGSKGVGVLTLLAAEGEEQAIHS
jgi:hypothetical protein